MRRWLSLLSLLLPATAVLVHSLADWPSNAYRDVAKFLRRSAAWGDVVVLTPEWNLDPLRHFAASSVPVLAAANGDPALQAGASRVWLVSAPWSTGAPPLPASLRALESRRISGIRVDLLVPAAPRAGGRG